MGLRHLRWYVELKEEKYRALASELSDNMRGVKVEAIIVGSLSSWDPNNDRLIKRICSEKYAKVMRRIIVSETILILRMNFSNI